MEDEPERFNWSCIWSSNVSWCSRCWCVHALSLHMLRLSTRIPRTCIIKVKNSHITTGQQLSFFRCVWVKFLLCSSDGAKHFVGGWKNYFGCIRWLTNRGGNTLFFYGKLEWNYLALAEGNGTDHSMSL